MVVVKLVSWPKRAARVAVIQLDVTAPTRVVVVQQAIPVRAARVRDRISVLAQRVQVAVAVAAAMTAMRAMQAAAAEWAYMAWVPAVLGAVPHPWDIKADLAAVAAAMHRA